MDNMFSTLFYELVKEENDTVLFIREQMEVKITLERYDIPVIRQELVERCNKYNSVSGYHETNQRNDPSALPFYPQNEGNERSIDVPVLSVTPLKDVYKGTHEPLSVFEYSPEGKIILKKILKRDKKSIKEILASVKLQKTGISPAIYLIVETYTTYDVYMEMIYPGITLAEVTEILPINSNKRIKYIHCIIYKIICAMQIIWSELRSHNDIHDRNIMIQPSNECFNIRTIDFGDVEIITEVTSESIKTDMIQLFTLIKEFLKQLKGKGVITLDEYKQKKEEYLSIEKIDELKNKVYKMAMEFGKDRAANQEICEMITKMSKDRAAYQEANIPVMTNIGEDEDKRCSCSII